MLNSEIEDKIITFETMNIMITTLYNLNKYLQFYTILIKI